MRRIFQFVSGFFFGGVLLRLVICMVLMLISVAMMLASSFTIATVFDKAYEYVKAAVQYDPYLYAKGLYDGGHIADADEFLDFYGKIPNAEVTDAMRTLQDDIRDTRGSVKYQLNEAVRGVVDGESDEIAGQSIAFLTEYLFIGDLRDLSGEGKKYFQGEEVDSLTISLATIGLGMSAISFWGPQVAAAVPAKNGLRLFKRLGKTLKPSMRKDIGEVGEIAGKLAKAKLDEVAASSSSFWDSVKTLQLSDIENAWSKSPPVDEKLVLRNADDVKKMETAISSIKKTGELYVMDRKAAAFVIKNSDDLRILEKNAELAKKLGKNGGVMLESGGVSVLHAVEKHSPTLIQEALVYGKSGVNYLLVKGSTRSLRAIVRSAKMTYTGKMLYHLANFIHAFPREIMFGMAVFLFGMAVFILEMAAYMLIKMCLPRSVLSASHRRA